MITKSVGAHQTCGIKGRSKQTNIHVALSVLECTNDNMNQVALFQIDLSRSFGEVRHDFLFQLLRHLQLGDVLCNGISLCYKKCITRIIVNCVLSGIIEVNSSVRQGCPPSPLLFAV